MNLFILSLPERWTVADNMAMPSPRLNNSKNLYMICFDGGGLRELTPLFRRSIGISMGYQRLTRLAAVIAQIFKPTS